MGSGRTKSVIDWNKVDKYLQAQCDGVGIAGLIGIHPNTLYEACKTEFKISFSEYSAIKKTEGKELLRAKQFQSAMDGDKTMQIWLGKQYLGQKDKMDQSSDNGSMTPVPAINVIDKETAEVLKDLIDGK